MKNLILICLFFLFIGCKKLDYSGRCLINKEGGRVTSVEVTLPGMTMDDKRSESDFTISNSEDLDKLVSGLESLVADLKKAREEMNTTLTPEVNNDGQIVK